MTRLPAAGEVINKTFEIVSFIGTGGMSSVYKAKHLLVDRMVALKILNEKLISDQGALLRFQQEAKVVSGLTHPNIIKVFGFGLFESAPFMAMEFLEGTSLADLLKQKQRLPIEIALPIFNQIATALEYAHEHGILHRDLKPSNVILLGPENEVKLIDFGIAKILPETGKEMQKLTQTGEIMGTIPYMSPEQCLSGKLDARSDIYSFGCMMYEVLDGSVPFQGENSFSTINKHINEVPRESAFITRELRRIIFSAMEKDPLKRPQSATVLLQALENPNALKSSMPAPTVKIKGLLIIAIAIASSLSFFMFDQHQRNNVDSKSINTTTVRKAIKGSSQAKLSRIKKAIKVRVPDKLALAALRSDAEEVIKDSKSAALLSIAYRYLDIIMDWQEEPIEKRKPILEQGLSYTMITNKQFSKESANYLNALGYIYCAEGNYIKAKEIAQQALIVINDPKTPNLNLPDHGMLEVPRIKDIYQLFGEIAVKEQKYPLALKWYEKGLSEGGVDPNSDPNGIRLIVLRKTEALMKMNRKKNALQVLNKYATRVYDVAHTLGANNIAGVSDHPLIDRSAQTLWILEDFSRKKLQDEESQKNLYDLATKCQNEANQLQDNTVMFMPGR